MNHSSGFTLADGTEDGSLELARHPGEEVVGVYRNPPPWEESRMVFTSHAIWLVEGEHAEPIALKDIVGYESPDPTTELATGIRVRTKDGFRFLRAAGTYGPCDKYKDYLGLVGVVRAVVASANVP